MSHTVFTRVFWFGHHPRAVHRRKVSPAEAVMAAGRLILSRELRNVSKCFFEASVLKFFHRIDVFSMEIV